MEMTRQQQQLLDEYDSLTARDETELLKKRHFTAALANLGRNRYANIWPFDWSRVRLNVASDASDYINASHIIIPKNLDVAISTSDIPSSSGNNEDSWKFVASQGPLKDTVPEFWQMIWEQQSTVILMLANLIERGSFEKCFQYWPAGIGDSVTLKVRSSSIDSIQVCFDSEQSHRADSNENEELITERTFTLSAIKGDKVLSKRMVKQVHFRVWPDHGVPKLRDISFLIRYMDKLFTRDVLTYRIENMVVHCSAGVGRTGTFIAIYSMLLRMREWMKFKSPRDVCDWQTHLFKTISLMRTQRPFMVETESQYIFCHQVLSNYLPCDNDTYNLESIN